MLHLGFTHIVNNMISQLLFGSMLEAVIGFKHFMGLYIVSG